MRVEARKRSARDRALGRPDDRQLAVRGEMEVECAKGVTEARRRALEVVAYEAQDADCSTLEFVVSIDPCQPQEHGCEHRVPGRRRIVVELLLPRDKLLSVSGCEEEA